MKPRTGMASAAVLALATAPFVFVQAAHADAGFTVSDGRLLDANGNDFVMRGVSHPHAWFGQELGSLEDISSLGANAVRVVLGSGQRWGPNDAADVAGVVDECQQHELVCMLEVHDTTGYGEESEAATLDEAVDYWIDIQSAVEGQEDYVLINIGNEPYGNDEETNANWAADTADAIGRLRDAGFDHTLVVDAPNWGQDWQQIMLDEAADVFAADPHANTVFSIHMYGVYETETAVEDYLTTFVDAGLPLMIGEFGHQHSDGDPAEDAIMAHAEELGLGYVGWSWSGNSDEVSYLDMVENFDVDQLTSWGERIFHGPDGIAETAECATVYDCDDDGNGDDDGNDDGDTSCAVSVSANWWEERSGAGGFTANLEITNTGDAAIDGWSLDVELASGHELVHGWSAGWSQDGSSLTAVNADWNAVIDPGDSAGIGFNGSWTGTFSEPTDVALNGEPCDMS
ncbi:beta-mannosidase [Actinobacteria bacterium YIM 96077]|uniref:Endoglucanase n=1 Tax=Phytoactinopolyspora halophila TaxID=1981511 RepID=A0A329R034_9ACTN|nr:cellulase family glycosylhydrolase [Phytoactinopolyspora halophila]AYY15149.1 beta-mannosidase [Actinobacteria bacterium YIM 96077]RAW17951.1 beta-mannosidase [Phytoactinopolyspora halophila]